MLIDADSLTWHLYSPPGVTTPTPAWLVELSEMRGRVLYAEGRRPTFGGTGAQVQLGLLKQVAPYLPQQCRIHFYGDCEFRATSLQAYCRERHWHWHAGLKGDTYVTLADGTEWQLRDLVKQGERRYWQDVSITKNNFGPVNLIADWSPNQEYARFWRVPSGRDLPANPAAWRRGRKRFWIEPTFRDWKSYGFDLEATQITDRKRLAVLILGMAVTTLWMIHIGSWLTHYGYDSDLDRTQHPDFSLFRQGRDRVTRARTMNWSIPVGFTVLH